MAEQARRDLDLPEALISEIRKRSNRTETSRFPYKLWKLLSWAGHDRTRGELCGCGWLSENEFFISKSKLCEVLNIKLNTLNVNLKTLGFEQSKSRIGDKTFWKNPAFSASSTENFQRVRNSRCKPESLINLSTQAVYMPVLEPLQLYMMSTADTNLFKKNVVELWEMLVGSKLVFAVAMADFINMLWRQLCMQAHGNEVHSLIQHVFVVTKVGVINIFDFALFLARFGPFNSIQDKLLQFQEIIRRIQAINSSIMFQTSMSEYFSLTFHNCFRFQIPTTGEYHCYNLPLVETQAQFLVDEDGAMYGSWRQMLAQNVFLSQNHMQ